MIQTTPTRDEVVREPTALAAFLRISSQRRDIPESVRQQIIEAADLLSAPAPASGGVDAVAVSRMDVVIALREWFGGERYARDYEYLDMQMGPQMKATLEAVFKDRRERASLSPAATPVSEAGGELKQQVRPYEETLSAFSVVAEHFALDKPASPEKD